MKILHIGGLNFATSALSKAQAAAGHDAQTTGISPSAPPLFRLKSDSRSVIPVQELLSQRFDLAHYHDVLDQALPTRAKPVSARTTPPNTSASLPTGNYAALLAGLRQSRVPVVFSACARDPLSEQAASAEGLKTLFSSFPHIFVTRSEQAPLLDAANKWSWLPLAVDLQAFPPPATAEPSAQNMRILHIPFDFSPEDTECIIDAIARMRSRGLRFHFTFSSPTEFKTEADLVSAIASSDLFVEDLQNSCPGPLAVLAMALGKSVISGNSRQARNSWNQLQHCPVLHADQSSIFKRLESVIREPRSLRDIGRRSRDYVERYHDSKLAAAQTLEVYRKLVP